MKRASLHRRNTRGSRKSALAASFVVTFAAQGAGGCKKQPVDTPEPESGRSTSSVYREYDQCFQTPQISCPKNATCNPPAPILVDCPADMRDAGDPRAVTRRPPGKEDWLRVKPQLWSMSATTCTYQPESFCAPPGKPYECTPYPKGVTVPCTKGDAGTLTVESFVYQDGLGACRKAPAFECAAGTRCEPPEGEVVPCP